MEDDDAMVSALTFLAVFLIPLVLFFINSGIASRDRRGIAAGIPKPKQAKPPKAARQGRSRPARVRARLVDDCGRSFTHLALALFGSEEACKYCRYLEEMPTTKEGPHDDGESGAPANEPIPLIRPANE